MKTLKDAACGDTFTVRKVRGDRAFVDQMAAVGIMRGSDVTLTAMLPDGGMAIRTGCKELSLAAQQAEQIVVEEQFVRKSSDPVFFSGCCAYGNSAGIWDRINGKCPSAKED